MKRLYLLLAAIFLILVLLPLFLDNYALGIFVMIFFWAYVGQSWNVLTGYSWVTRSISASGLTPPPF